jgi:phosphate transport system substrate-binding protein
MKRAVFRTLFLVASATTTAVSQVPFEAGPAIWVDGSPGVLPLVTTLAARYRSAFRSPLPPVINFGRGLGTSARIAAVKDGTIDIALASHGVIVGDLERQGLTAYKFADVPVGFAVHDAVGVDDLTEAQICDIYAGRIRNWKELGGIDLAIIPASRPKGEVDADVILASMPCMSSLPANPRVVSKELPDDMAAFLDATPGVIGMTSATVAWQSTKLRMISIGGVAPTATNVADKRYPMSRESFLVYRATPAPAVRAFIDFIRGPEGGALIRESGGIPR